MPILTNLRHEAFAHAIARGEPASRAYVEAGYKANDGNAGSLNRNQSVKARVAELTSLVQNMKSQTASGVVLTQAWVIEQLIGVALDARAQEKPDSAGANKALHLLGLELGMFVERKETGKPGEFDGLTIADKRGRILGIARTLGLAPMATLIEHDAAEVPAIKPDDETQD